MRNPRRTVRPPKHDMTLLLAGALIARRAYRLAVPASIPAIRLGERGCACNRDGGSAH